MSNRPTLRQLASELDRLRARVEDLEDLRDLREEIERNGDKALIPWTRVKRELNIDKTSQS
ncbi:MAG TPA: hypothetical protein VK687_05170 [Bryobacteraceae bacterium]|nr:hypothetical protein [Bryobacteraceae bacterium]